MSKRDSLEMLDAIGRDTPEDEIEYLRAQLAEVTALKDRLLQTVATHAEEVGGYYSQLLATQAHAARLVAALDKHGTHDKGCAALAWNKNNDDVIPDAYCDCGLYSALSTPINLDALHEALACECERLANMMASAEPATVVQLAGAIVALRREAADHRAKKAGK